MDFTTSPPMIFSVKNLTLWQYMWWNFSNYNFESIPHVTKILNLLQTRVFGNILTLILAYVMTIKNS